MSHAAPNVRNVNDPAAKANPMTYQIPVKAILAPSAGGPWGSRPLDGWSLRPLGGTLAAACFEAFATNRQETAVALRNSIVQRPSSGPRSNRAASGRRRGRIGAAPGTL